MKVYAVDLPSIVGSVENPINSSYAGLGGVGLFITNIIRLLFVAAGVFALFNFLTAGFEYINAGGDSKKLEKAWSKIWQSLMGLVIMASSFAIASVIGYILFGSSFNLLSPTIYGPAY